MPKLPTFRRSTVGAALLLTTVMAVNTASLAAVPINSFYGAWSSTVTYPKGSVITSGGSSYISLLGTATNPNVNHPPLTSSKWWSSFAAQGSQGVPGPTGPMGGMVVKDSNGKVVGPYIYTLASEESVAVKNSTGTIIFSLIISSISPSGEPLFDFGPIRHTRTGQTMFYFATNDCTGTPYADTDINDAGFFHVQLVVGGNYYPATARQAPTVPLMVNSTLTGFVPTCLSSNFGQTLVVPLTNGTPLSSLGFTPPFTIQLN